MKSFDERLEAFQESMTHYEEGEDSGKARVIVDAEELTWFILEAARMHSALNKSLEYGYLAEGRIKDLEKPNTEQLKTFLEVHYGICVIKDPSGLPHAYVSFFPLSESKKILAQLFGVKWRVVMTLINMAMSEIGEELTLLPFIEKFQRLPMDAATLATLKANVKMHILEYEFRTKNNIKDMLIDNIMEKVELLK